MSGEAELSNLLGGVPFEEAADGKESSMFQFLRGALVSHATQCTRSRLRRTLLFSTTQQRAKNRPKTVTP